MQTTERQKAKTEILSLLDVLYNKIDLERAFGVKQLQFPQIIKTQASVSKSVDIKQKPEQEAKQETENSSSDADKTISKPMFIKPVSSKPELDKSTLDKSEKAQKLKELKEQVRECTQCGLSKSRTNVVFGTGSPDADLMFVGEAPGYYEDVQGEPFVGKAGQLLTKIIEAMGFKRSDVYIANILKCRPPENRNPAANEIVLCTPYLIEQIEIINPKIICALGTFAAQTLLNTGDSIGSLRGRFHEYQGTKLLATYHPAYLLRNPNEKKKTWEDMKKVRDFLKDA